MKIYYVIFSLIAISFFLVQCQDTKKAEENYSDVHSIEAPQDPIDRIKEIEKCASCHQEEYKNWLIGPHANAYKNIVKYVHYVDSSDSYSNNYKKHVSSEFSTVCISCHTGQNLYETMFKGLDTEMNERHFNNTFYPNMSNARPSIRKGNFSNLNTSVDCLTCHKSGDNVVTNASYTKKDQEMNNNNCKPIGSKYFSTNLNCLPCHEPTVTSMKELVATGKIKNEINCNSCHMEYNQKGKATHYYFWKHDVSGKKRPEKLNLFSDLNAEIRTVNGKQQLFFHWGNNYIPHYFTCSAEVVAIIDLKDKNGKSLIKFSAVANNKERVIKIYNAEYAEYLKEGKTGNPLNMNDSPIERTIPIETTIKEGKIIIQGMYKEQYWSNDKELKEVYRKEILIK